MVIIELTQQVTTDAELTALTGMSSQHIVWHTGISKACIYEPNFGTGDYTPDVDSGFWCIDNIEGLDLAGYKALRRSEIDIRTGELIALGFSYGGKVMSLSQNAQLNLNGANQTRTELTYPVTFHTIDSLDSYDATDATDLHNLYLTALGTKKAHIDSGAILRDSINSAVDEAAVQLIIDNR
ncbi:MAG: hypothetical protein ACQ9ET_00245 [Nitrosomonadaceae bacterium]